MPKAEYKCLNPVCEFEWVKPKSDPTPCVKCNHMYVKWTNFEKDFEIKKVKNR
jgi:hypothetical protein